MIASNENGTYLLNTNRLEMGKNNELKFKKKLDCMKIEYSDRKSVLETLLD